MSISNILEPNNLNLFCGSITSENPPPILGKLIITNTTSDGTANININQVDITSHTNDIQFSSNGTPILYVGENPTNNETYISALGDLRIDTNFVERIRIDKNGIPNNNISLTNILGLNGTVLEYKNNMVDTNTVQTLTNKTFDVLTISNGVLCNNRYPVHGSIPANSTAIILLFTLPVNTSVVVSMVLAANCLSGANQGYSDILFDFKLVNNGVVSGSAGNNAFNSEANLTGTYVGHLSPNILVSLGNIIDIQLISTLATGPITYGGYVDVCYA